MWNIPGFLVSLSWGQKIGVTAVVKSCEFWRVSHRNGNVSKEEHAYFSATRDMTDTCYDQDGPGALKAIFCIETTALNNQLGGDVFSVEVFFRGHELDMGGNLKAVRPCLCATTNHAVYVIELWFDAKTLHFW